MTRAAWVLSARKLVRNRRDGLRILVALLRGTCYALFFRLFRRDVVIELPFFAYERVTILGPGRVRIGTFCSVYPNVFKGLSIVTLSKDAVVRIGPHCALGGLTVRCREAVTIGERTMCAHTLVQDVLLFSQAEGQRALRAPFTGAVQIGRNAWLGGLTCVLPRATVGQDSVLSWGATCFDTVVPGASVASGNPVMRSVPIDRLRKFAKE